MTLRLYISKAITPPGTPGAGAKPAGPDLSNAEYVSEKKYPGGLPPGTQIIKQTDHGWYVPKGALGNAAGAEDTGKDKSKEGEKADTSSPTEPIEVNEALIPDPKDISDPLKNDDGTALGEEKLTPEEDTVPDATPAEEPAPAATATDADTKAEGIISKLSGKEPTGSTAGSPGPKGATGDKGATGAAGKSGGPGTAGAKGTSGSKGPAGAQGKAGAKGKAGANGPAGSKGPSGSKGSSKSKAPEKITKQRITEAKKAREAAVAQDTKAKNLAHQSKRRITALQDKNNSLRESLKDKKKQLKDLSSKVEGKSTARITKLKNDISTAESNIKSNKKAIKASKKEVAKEQDKAKVLKDKADANKDLESKNVPNTPAEVLEHKAYTENAKAKADEIQAHIDELGPNPDSTKLVELLSLHEIYTEQAELEHMPDTEAKAALGRADRFAKTRGVDKHPDVIKQEAADQKAKDDAKIAKTKEAEAKKAAQAAKKQAAVDAKNNKTPKETREANTQKTAARRGSSAMAAFNRGRSIGAAAGRFGTAAGGTEIIRGAANIPKAGIAAGHYLLNRPKKNQPEPEADKTKKEVTKSMKLYIPLKKAGPTTSSARDSDKPEEQNEEEYEESFSQRTAGIMGGDATPDRPGPGPKMNAKKSMTLFIGGLR